MANLLSVETMVESPFVIVKIGTYTFGHASKYEHRQQLGNVLNVTYPNYMLGIEVTKINGVFNNYIIKMVYQITPGDDPNMLEKVFGTVSKTREIEVSYGDWNSPGFIYRKETALLTDVKSRVDFAGSRIYYTLYAISNSMALMSGNFNFPKRVAKPSDVLKEVFTRYNLKDVFYGMTKSSLLNKLVASDDARVEIEAKNNISLINYMNYLVSCMVSNGDNPQSTIRSSHYSMAIFDEVTNDYNGPYFKVVKVPTTLSQNASADSYTIDVGFPTNNFVMDFSLDSDETYSILYNYAGGGISLPDYVYRIDNNGDVKTTWSPNIAMSKSLFKPTQSANTWWTQVTQFPISASLTLKGLIRPTMLMTYININALFYGSQYIASGTYIITKQHDVIDSNGYRTILSLTRIPNNT